MPNTLLPWLIFIPLLAGVLSWLSGRIHAQAPRWVALAGMVAVAVAVCSLWPTAPQTGWWSEFHQTTLRLMIGMLIAPTSPKIAAIRLEAPSRAKALVSAI